MTTENSIEHFGDNRGNLNMDYLLLMVKKKKKQKPVLNFLIEKTMVQFYIVLRRYNLSIWGQSVMMFASDFQTMQGGGIKLYTEREKANTTTL